MKNGLRVLAFIALVFCIASCGKMSEPSPIEGSGYPHTYPRR